MSKHFCACMGACTCDRMPLLKRPDFHFTDTLCYLWIKIKILPLPKSNTSSCKNISKTLLFPIVSSKYLSYACSISMVLPDGIDAGVTSYLNKGKSKISFM